MIACTMLMKYKTETHMEKNEQIKLAMTIIYLVDYVLKWLLALIQSFWSISSQASVHICHKTTYSTREFLSCLLYCNK